MTPTDEPIRLPPPNMALPVSRPYYANLSEFERQVLDSRQADLGRETVLEWDPYA